MGVQVAAVTNCTSLLVTRLTYMTEALPTPQATPNQLQGCAAVNQFVFTVHMAPLVDVYRSTRPAHSAMEQPALGELMPSRQLALHTDAVLGGNTDVKPVGIVPDNWLLFTTKFEALVDNRSGC